MKPIVIRLNDGSRKVMSLEEMTRWGCLVEALEFILGKADDLGVELVGKLLNPIAIEKYINERYHSLRYDVGISSGREF